MVAAAKIRRWSFLTLLIGCTWTLVFSCQKVSADDSTPNILFIFSDDHACAAVSCYGSQLNQTPHIDRIAAEGMRFDRCLVTNSICGPSRAVILTGKYSHLNGFRQNGDQFDGTQPTFVQQLQTVGYQTAIVGKWHLGSDPVGFDHWSILLGQGEYYNPRFKSRDGIRESEGYATDLITDQAIDWLRAERDTDRPFMLMVQHKAPHREWQPGPDHLDDFAKDLPEPASLLDDYAGRPAVVRDQEMTIARHMRMGFDLKYFSASGDDDEQEARFFRNFTPAQRRQWEAAYNPQNAAFESAAPTGDELTRWKYQRYIKDYLRCVASIDDGIGRLLEELDKQDLSKNTVVIYSSDQGFFLGEHGWYDKRWIFEPSLSTPLVVRWPGVIESGSSTDRIVSNLDFAQTFLDIAGQLPTSPMQGASLVPLMHGESPADWRESFYYHYYELSTHNVPAHYGVVTDRHKLVCYYQTPGKAPNAPINEWELLDRELDPEEMRSYLGEPSHHAVRDELFAELQRLKEKYGDEEVSNPLPQ